MDSGDFGFDQADVTLSRNAIQELRLFSYYKSIRTGSEEKCNSFEVERKTVKKENRRYSSQAIQLFAKTRQLEKRSAETQEPCPRLPTENEALEDFLVRVQVELSRELQSSKTSSTKSRKPKETNECKENVCTQASIVSRSDEAYSLRRLEAVQNYNSLLKGNGPILEEYNSTFVTKSLSNSTNDSGQDDSASQSFSANRVPEPSNLGTLILDQEESKSKNETTTSQQTTENFPGFHAASANTSKSVPVSKENREPIESTNRNEHEVEYMQDCKLSLVRVPDAEISQGSNCHPSNSIQGSPSKESRKEQENLKSSPSPKKRRNSKSPSKTLSGSVSRLKSKRSPNRSNIPLTIPIESSNSNQSSQINEFEPEPCCSKSLDIPISKDVPRKRDFDATFIFQTEKIEHFLPKFIRDQYLKNLADNDPCIVIDERKSLDAVLGIRNAFSAEGPSVQDSLSDDGIHKRGKRNIKLPKRFHDDDCPCCHTPSKIRQSVIKLQSESVPEDSVAFSSEKSEQSCRIECCLACDRSLSESRETQLPREINLCGDCAKSVEEYYDEPWKHVNRKCQSASECSACINCYFWAAVSTANKWFLRKRKKRCQRSKREAETIDAEIVDMSVKEERKRRKIVPVECGPRVRRCLRRSLNPSPVIRLSALPEEEKAAVRIRQEKAWEDETPVYQLKFKIKTSYQNNSEITQKENIRALSKSSTPKKTSKRKREPVKIASSTTATDLANNSASIEATENDNWDCTISEAIALSLIVETNLDNSGPTEKTGYGRSTVPKSHRCPVLRLQRIVPCGE